MTIETNNSRTARLYAARFPNGAPKTAIRWAAYMLAEHGLAKTTAIATAAYNSATEAFMHGRISEDACRIEMARYAAVVRIHAIWNRMEASAAEAEMEAELANEDALVAQYD